MKLHTQDRYRLRGSDKAAGGAKSEDHMFDHMTHVKIHRCFFSFKCAVIFVTFIKGLRRSWFSERKCACFMWKSDQNDFSALVYSVNNWCGNKHCFCFHKSRQDNPNWIFLSSWPNSAEFERVKPKQCGRITPQQTNAISCHCGLAFIFAKMFTNM